MNRSEVYAAIDSERRFQDQRWGTIEQHPHEVGSWILIMEKLLADARSAWAGSCGDIKALDEIRKVAAVAVACGEQYGLYPRPSIAFAKDFGPNPDRKSSAEISNHD